MNIAPDYPQLSDEELFELVKQHDDAAFRVLYKRYDKRLFAYSVFYLFAVFTALVADHLLTR